MVEKIKRITCSRCGKSIELKDKDFDSIGRTEVFKKTKGWYVRFNGHSDVDLCPECAAMSDSLWNTFISGGDFNDQKDSEKIVVPTTAGKITAKQTPDPEYPGIIMELESKNGRPGVIMEYDPEKEEVFVRVWGKDDPDGDLIYVVEIGGKED